MKAILKTILNNITYKGDEYNYTEELVSIKWTPEPDSQPGSFVKVIQPHLSDDLNRCNGSSECEISSDKPRDKESIQ